jgi:hypothetical protein
VLLVDFAWFWCGRKSAVLERGCFSGFISSCSASTIHTFLLHCDETHAWSIVNATTTSYIHDLLEITKPSML